MAKAKSGSKDEADAKAKACKAFRFNISPWEEISGIDRSLRLSSFGHVSLDTFVPSKRLLPGDYDKNETPMHKRQVLVLREDAEKKGKKGIYSLIYCAPYGLRILDMTDDFHDEIRIGWNSLTEVGETCIVLRLVFVDVLAAHQS